MRCRGVRVAWRWRGERWCRCWDGPRRKKRLLPGLVVYVWPVGAVMMTVPSANCRSDQPGKNVLIRWWHRNGEGRSRSDERLAGGVRLFQGQIMRPDFRPKRQRSPSDIPLCMRDGLEPALDQVLSLSKTAAIEAARKVHSEAGDTHPRVTGGAISRTNGADEVT